MTASASRDAICLTGRRGSKIEVRALRRIYGATTGDDVVGLRDLDLDIASGEILALEGPSGSGKSTLLHLIGGMDRPDSGSIRVDDLDLTILREKELAEYRRTVGFVFQRFHLLPHLDALDNVMLPLLPYRTPFDKKQRATDLLERLGLGERLNHAPGRLSGGEQQRVAIARALVNSPGLILADEPTGNLDSDAGQDVLSLLLSLREEFGTTLLVATHDPTIAGRCDRAVELKDGHRIR